MVKELKRKLGQAYKEEKEFWQQKVRVKWLREGDRNTALFHASVRDRRRMNRISTLQKKDRNWCNIEKEIQEELVSYYQNLFASIGPDNLGVVLEGVPCSITSQMNARLIKPVDDAEIKEAVFSMLPDKASSPDGMSPYFFQKFWHVIQANVVNAVKSFFHGGHFLKAINETLITLIPKLPIPLT